MEMMSGKHQGKTTEEILLKEPDYAVWYMGEYPESRAGRDFRRLEKAFDAKPFVAECRCGQKAVRVSGYRGSPLLMFWCAECSPTGSGAEPQKLRYPVNTYRAVLEHISLTADGYKNWKKDIVRGLAEGKGLKTPLSKKKLAAFFAAS
jgi:hypothetical protein